MKLSDIKEIKELLSTPEKTAEFFGDMKIGIGMAILNYIGAGKENHPEEITFSLQDKEFKSYGDGISTTVKTTEEEDYRSITYSLKENFFSFRTVDGKSLFLEQGENNEFYVIKGKETVLLKLLEGAARDYFIEFSWWLTTLIPEIVPEQE